MPRLREGQSKAKSRSVSKRSRGEVDSSPAPAINRRIEKILDDQTGAAADAYATTVAERDALVARLKFLEMKKKRLQEQLRKRRTNELDSLDLCIAGGTDRVLSLGKNDVTTYISPHLLVTASLRRELRVTDVMSTCGRLYDSRHKKSDQLNLLQAFLLVSTRICLHYPDENTIIRVVTELCGLKRYINTKRTMTKQQILDIDPPFLSEAVLTAFSQMTAPWCFMHTALRICRTGSAMNALGKLPILHSIDLSGTYITDDDVKTLKRNSTLVKIYMNECMCLRDVSPLADILTLEKIQLSGCAHLSIVSALGKLPALRSLNLKGTCITNDELKAVCESRTLLNIILTDCCHLTDVSYLASVKTLQDVQCCNSSFISGLEALGMLPDLHFLDLRNACHKNDIITDISVSRTLVKLDIGKCGHLQDVSPVAAIHSLQELSLSGSYIFHGIGTLGELRSLLVLDLSRTNITSDELLGFSKLPVLVKIDLSKCRCLHDVSCLASIETLQEVCLQRNGSLNGLDKLSKLPLLHSLDLSRSRPFLPDLKWISECCALVKLNLHNSLKGQDVSPLASIKTLEEINLSKNRIRGAGLLGKLPALRFLDMSLTNINDRTVMGISESRTLINLILVDCRSLKNVSPLSSIETLKEINLSGCPQIAEAGTLGELPALHSLNLESTAITNDVLYEISESRTLVKLNLNYCTYGNPLEDVSPLANMKTLEEVSLRGSESASGLKALGALPALRVLDVEETDGDAVIRIIQHSRSLVQINLSECWYVKNLPLLASINSLKEINLSECMYLEGLDTLGQLPSLRFLNLSKSDVESSSLQGISNSPSLVKLDLSKCVELIGISPLARINTLEELYLSDCTKLDPCDAGVLGKSHAFRILNLSGTPIKNDVLLGLSESHTLVKLDVSYCYCLTDASPLASIKTLGELILLECLDNLIPNALQMLTIRLKCEKVYCSDDSDDDS